MPTAVDPISPISAVLKLALPAIAYSVLQTFIFIADRAMLGHHEGASLAAMQIASPIEWSVWSVFMAFEVGTLARIGYLYGAKELPRARALAQRSVALSIACGFLVMVLAPAVCGLLPSFAPKATPEVVQRAADYLMFTLGASPVVFLGLAAGAVFQGLNDTRTPLIAGVLANAIHIPLNLLFIFGGMGIPAMGTRGCGMSSALTFALESLFLYAVLRRRMRAFEGPIPDRATVKADLGELFRVSTPSFIERFVYHTGFTAFISIITRLGETAMAANQVLISMESLCFLTADGFGIAAASLVAQRLGANNKPAAIASARAALFLAIATLFGIGVLLVLGRSIFIPAFSNDPRVHALASSIIPFFMFAEPLLAFASVLAQSLRGAGYTRDALLATIVSAVGVRVLATYVLAIHYEMGLLGIWFGSTIDWLVRAAMLFYFVKKRSREALRDDRASPAPS